MAALLLSTSGCTCDSRHCVRLSCTTGEGRPEVFGIFEYFGLLDIQLASHTSHVHCLHALGPDEDESAPQDRLRVGTEASQPRFALEPA